MAFPSLPRAGNPIQNLINRGNQAQAPTPEGIIDGLVPSQEMGGIAGLAEAVNDWITDFFGQQPTDLFFSPNESVSPTDCERYPDSPFCAGLEAFGGIIPRIETQISRSECETCFYITPVLGWRLPPLIICRRLSNCPKEKQDQPPQEPEETEEPTPEEWELIGQYSELEINAEKKVKTQLSSGQGLEEYWENEITLITRVNTEANIISTFERQFKTFGKARNCTLWKVTKNNERYDINAISIYNGWSVGYPGVWKNQRAIYYVVETTVYQEWLLYGHEVGSDGESYIYPYEDPSLPFSYNPGRPPSYTANVEYVAPLRKYRYWFLNNTIQLNETAQSNGFVNEQTEGFFNRTPKKPPPQEPLMNNCDCRQIQEDLKKIKKILGVDRFPANAPRRLIQARKGGQVQLKDYVDIFEYQTRQVDRAIGFLPFTIEVKDVDSVNAGNQPMKVEVESLGDGVREIVQILLDSTKDSGATLNVALRTLYEAGITHKLTAEIHKEVQEIIEFLGYEIEENTTKVKFAFNPIAEGLREINNDAKLEQVLPKILQEKEVGVKFSENRDKRTLIMFLLQLLQNSEAAAAPTTVRLKNQNSLDALMKSASLGMDIAQLVMLRDIKRALGQMPEHRFREYLDELEKRYTKEQSPVAGDNNEPFQQDREAKIKIQETKVETDRTRDWKIRDRQGRRD